MIKALGRFFRDRITSTATTIGHTNNSRGSGVGVGALIPFVNKKLDAPVEDFVGQGIGQYGSAGLPDASDGSRRVRLDFECDPTAQHRAEDFLQRFRIRMDSLLQLDLASFIHHAVPTVAISQIQSDGQLCCEIFLLCFTATVLTFFIAGLLYLLCLEHVDNLEAYTASPPETGLLIPSD